MWRGHRLRIYNHSGGLPESRAWVGVGGEYYVLGAIARHQFRGISQLKELKYELAVPKVCGALWYSTVLDKTCN